MSNHVDAFIDAHPPLAALHSRELIAEALAVLAHRLELVGRIEERERKSDD